MRDAASGAALARRLAQEALAREAEAEDEEAEAQRRSLFVVPPFKQGPYSGLLSSAVSNVSGPTTPIFVADLPPDESLAFQGSQPTALPTRDPRFPVATFALKGCDLAAVKSSCPAALSSCLAQTVSVSSGICACYFSYAQCYAALGCIEQLPPAEVDYCFKHLACSLDQCEGSGSSAAALGAAALAAALAAAAALLAF